MNVKKMLPAFLSVFVISVGEAKDVQDGPTAAPNIIIIIADDLGYGDLSSYGHPLIRTPNIDRLANEGQKWTSFYAAAPWCNPSRLALMTGRMNIRISQNEDNRVLSMPSSETTMGEMLKSEGYATAYIGKWGMSFNFQEEGSHANDQGFDYFFGLESSNDGPIRKGLNRSYDQVKNAESADYNTELLSQREVVETPANQPLLTKRYTEESVKWIKEHKEEPFFLYLSHSMPHVPVFASPEFEGRSKAGLYGDVIEEIDWSVGEVVKALEEAGVADNTLIFFTSDNGPWTTYYDLAGTAAPFRDGKSTGWEGAYRVPGIFWWPEKIKPSVVRDIGVNVDLISTIATITGASLPTDRSYDSIDLSDTLLNNAPSARDEWFFYGPIGHNNLWGARVGDYKLVYESWDTLGKEEEFNRGHGGHKIHNPPLLFNLSTDISERLNIADDHPDIVKEIQEAVEAHKKSIGKK